MSVLACKLFLTLCNVFIIKFPSRAAVENLPKIDNINILDEILQENASMCKMILIDALSSFGELKFSTISD